MMMEDGMGGTPRPSSWHTKIKKRLGVIHHLYFLQEHHQHTVEWASSSSSSSLNPEVMILLPQISS
jgi:hypothetical protein